MKSRTKGGFGLAPRCVCADQRRRNKETRDRHEEKVIKPVWPLCVHRHALKLGRDFRAYNCDNSKHIKKEVIKIDSCNAQKTQDSQNQGNQIKSKDEL